MEPFGGVSVPFPPVEPAEKLFDTKSESCEFESGFRGGIAADPVAVGDVSEISIEYGGASLVHRPMREREGFGDVLGSVGLFRAGIDDDDRLFSLQAFVQIPRVDLI